MNRFRLFFCLLSLAAALTGCAVKEKASPQGEGGAGNAVASGGASGGGGAGSCAPEQSGKACGDIPTTGVCACGNKVQYCNNPPPTADGVERAPVLVTVACGANKECRVDDTGVASCTLTKACEPGDTKCEGDSLQVCRADGSGYDATNCQASQKECRAAPGKPAQCIAPLTESAGNSTGPRLRGCVEFERRRMEKTGPSAELIVEKAFFQFVAIYNAQNYIGSAITDEKGCFNTDLTEAANASTDVYIFAMDIDPKTEQPLVSIVHADENSLENRTATQYWSWNNKAYDATVQPDPAAANVSVMPTFRIREAEGSGAIRIFQWVRYGLYRLNYTYQGADYGLEATKGKKQDSLLVFWSPGVDPPCGSCFLGRNGGGGTVALENGEDSYDTLMFISGSSGSPAHWSSSVIAHELGHWTMANYSKPPGEGGPHYVGQVSKPGLAWSEGWATAFGQWHISDTETGEYDPLYVDTQDGTTFWVDIANASTRRGNLPLPNSSDGIDQFINENVVSAMVWYLWQPAQAGAGPYQGIGEEGMFRTLQSPRIRQLNRGYVRTDLVDFYDAGRCANDLPNDAITNVSNKFQFPWDNSPLCQP